MTTDQPHEHATQLRNHWYWRPGWREGREFYTWHLTFEGQAELHRLVTAYQDALRDVPGLDLIPLDWLHLTVQGVGFTDEISLTDIRAIADAAAKRLAKLAPVELIFRQPVVRHEALAIPPEPVAPLFAIRNEIRTGIAGVWGKNRVPETLDQFQPHLSVAYANADSPAAPTLAALATVSQESVHIVVREASLIVLRRDGHLYRWQTFDRISFSAPLAGGRSSAGAAHR